MIDRDIILDLLPLYRAGLGSDATRRLVEAGLEEHPELGEAPTAEPESAEWRTSFARARRVSRRRRWVYGLAITLTVLCLALHISGEPGTGLQVRLLALDAPALFAPLAVAAALAWIAYWRMARRR